MSKPRLFIFGDSWAFNYFSKTNKDCPTLTPHFGNPCVENFASRYDYFGHWIDHIESFYDVYSYAVGGSCNEQIIYQFGNLPEYKPGDRIISIFTTPERFTWIYDKKTSTALARIDIKYNFPRYDTQCIIELFNEQFIERDKIWNDVLTQNNQKLFIDFLFVSLSKWKPVFSTWTNGVYSTVKSVQQIHLTKDFTNIYTETGGKCKDYHMGIRGNYEVFKYFSKKLELDITNYDYKLELKDFNKKIL
jgi:hypothetical protein